MTKLINSDLKLNNLLLSHEYEFEHMRISKSRSGITIRNYDPELRSGITDPCNYEKEYLKKFCMSLADVTLTCKPYDLSTVDQSFRPRK